MTLVAFLLWISSHRCAVLWSFPDPVSGAYAVHYGGNCLEAFRLGQLWHLPVIGLR